MRNLLLLIINFYQRLLSPLLPHQCRFYPSCSEYAKQAISLYGVKGVGLTTKRLLKCHPFHAGGVDFIS